MVDIGVNKASYKLYYWVYKIYDGINFMCSMVSKSI